MNFTSLENFSDSEYGEDKGESPGRYNAEDTKTLAKKLIKEIRQNGLGNLPLPLYECILILNNYRSECARLHKYQACEQISKILHGIRELEEKRHVATLKEEQVAERMNLDMQHDVEVDQLKKLWETRFLDFNTYIEELRSSMAERHLKEFEDFKLRFNFELNRTPKFSKRLINIRAVEQTLVKQGKFQDAQKVKKQGNMIQNQELIEKSQRIADRFERQKRLLLKRHNREAQALQVRIERIKHDLESGKKKDFENCKRRFANTLHNVSKSQSKIMKDTLKYIQAHRKRTRFPGMIPQDSQLPPMHRSYSRNATRSKSQRRKVHTSIGFRSKPKYSRSYESNSPTHSQFSESSRSKQQLSSSKSRSTLSQKKLAAIYGNKPFSKERRRPRKSHK